MQVLRLDSRAADFSTRLSQRLAYAEEADDAVERATAAILADVRARGDAAVLEYTAKFDGVNVESMAGLRVAKDDLNLALEGIPAAQRDALEAAAVRIRIYHEKQKAQS